MSVTSGSSQDSGTEPAGEDDGCDVCGHPLSQHDAVARRFCSASRGRAEARPCVCPAGAVDARPAAGLPGHDGPPMYGRGRFSGK